MKPLGLFFFNSLVTDRIMDTLRKNSITQNVPAYLGKRFGRWLLPVSIILTIVVWQAIISWNEFPAFILPSPRLVLVRLTQAVLDGSLFLHSAVTLFEVLIGLLIGGTLATILGYILARSRLLEKLVSPYLVASQAIPIVAIAPLLVIWFGAGITSKILVCSLIVFFPMLINTVVGLRAVPENLRDLMLSLKATKRQILLYLEIPSAMPIFLGGLRIGATLAVVGAVVGEFVGAKYGLGFLINVGRGQYDTALVFVAILTLVAMALTLYGIVMLLEKRLLKWHNRQTMDEL